MKNIHLLPTDKPSSVWINYVVNRLIYGQFTSNDAKINCQNQHIYITSDEEIKEGDYFISYSFTNKNPYISCASEYKERKEDKGKIILTTDQDLIKDGVQAIPDDFLEWFVKNPSCEEVKIIKVPYFDESGHSYLLIIPKEEPKFEESTDTTVDIILLANSMFGKKEETLTIRLNKKEARGLLNCIMRTSAKGKDLDVGEMVEDKLVEFLNLK